MSTLTTSSDFVLGVDLDNTLADYTGGFRRFVMQELGHETPYPDPEFWDFNKCKGWPIRSREHFLDLHHRAVSDGLFLNLDLYDGAQPTLVDFRAAGVKIRIISHRLLGDPYFDTTAVQDTVEWLYSKQIPFDDICFVSNKTEVDSHLIVEDSPAHLAALRAADRNFLIYHQRYNSHVVGLRVHSWLDVYGHVMQELGY